MDADGKNKFQALPTGVFGSPSALLYGGGVRWWLVAVPDGRIYNHMILSNGTFEKNVNFPHYELYAFSVNEDFSLVWQQVCDSYGKFRFAPTGDGASNAIVTQWSTEGLDLFAYGRGRDISDAFIVEGDGTTTLDNGRSNHRSLCRVDAGNGMTIGQSVEAGIKLGPEALTIVPGNWPTSNVQNFQFSADGETVIVEGNFGELELRDASTGDVLWIADVDGGNVRWSPLGGGLAFSRSSDGIWLMAAANEGFDPPVKIRAPSKKNNAWTTSPRWSPDAKHLLYLERVGWLNPTWQIYRMNSDGSNVVNLTGELDAGTLKRPFCWVSNFVAPPVED
ncbi:MAG: hypothetical protein WD069_12300 [Planctomycetales bacterium]